MTITAHRIIAFEPVPAEIDKGYIQRMQNTLTEYLGKMHDSLVTDDLVVSSGDALYLGDITTDGTWKIIRVGSDLSIQRRESGTYVQKSKHTA